MSEAAVKSPRPRRSKNRERFTTVVNDIVEIVRDAAEMAQHVEPMLAVVDDDGNDDRETPGDVYDPLHAEFSFTLDVAASAINHKTPRYCTRAGFFLGGVMLTTEHGLDLGWTGERVWCNPPFSNVRPWIERAWDEPAKVTVMVLPNNRCEQTFWSELIEPYRDRASSPLTTRFLTGRRHFTIDGGKPIMQPPRFSKATGKALKPARSSPEFGLVLAIWDRRTPRQRELEKLCRPGALNG